MNHSISTFNTQGSMQHALKHGCHGLMRTGS